MEKRALGGGDLEVSALGLGTMLFGGAGWLAAFGSTSASEAAELVDIALERGVNLFDTADIYSGGASETMLGEIARGRRQRMLIATKCFGRTGPGDGDVGLSQRHIVAACEASLRRLGIDCIDLCQVHSFDALVPLEETLAALTSLVKAGKVREVGCSNHFAWELTKALHLSDANGFARYAGQQVQYSLLVRETETEILPAAIAQQVGTIVWGPLAGGYLSGKFQQAASEGSRIDALGRLRSMDTPRARSVVARLDEIAAARSASPSQVAINWLLTRPGVSSVLVGARSADQLRDNLAAAEWTLGTDEIAALDACSATPAPYPQAQRAVFEPERNPPVFG